MNNSTGLDFKRYKRVCSEVSLPPFFLQRTVPFSEAFRFSYILSKSESSFSPSLLKWSTLYSLICSQPFFFFLSYNRTERPSSFFLQLHALLLFGVTEVNGSFLRQLTVLKVLWRRGERQIKGSTPRQLLSQPCTWKGEERTELKGSEKSLGIH